MFLVFLKWAMEFNQGSCTSSLHFLHPRFENWLVTTLYLAFFFSTLFTLYSAFFFNFSSTKYPKYECFPRFCSSWPTLKNKNFIFFLSFGPLKINHYFSVSLSPKFSTSELPMTPSPVLTYIISYTILTLFLPFNFNLCQFNKHLQPLALCRGLYMPHKKRAEPYSLSKAVTWQLGMSSPKR